ncbi:GMC family oxidoreductase [Pigmentibacter sp. JX0631]|uniref:GMC family oxidoreductase n=1 Tax=Pigmentibacter sp. JX0631 TaxID=2976982 RepID=UPI002469468B|nr:GMC family oxidoreductase [Pigmentibacter sp. JX0631]WGL58485.1 GMC family oxidoreductase [Pigmentibacter sp. JX0631]
MSNNYSDVVIVGSGVAGSLIAYKLSKHGIKVTILEAGTFPDRSHAMKKYYETAIKIPESAYQIQPHAPYPTTINSNYFINKGKENFKSTYLRVAGGTTWHWLGTCLRLVPEDFKMKTNFNLGIDWPISYSDLEEWYFKAEQELGVSGNNNEDLGSPRKNPYPLPEIPFTLSDKYFTECLKDTDYKICHSPQARNSVEFDSRPACCGSASCIPCCPVQAKYDATIHLNKAIKHGAKLITNAVAYEVVSDTTGKITAINYKKPDKKIESIQGKIFILAANSIETAKLLLMSKTENFKNGIANTSDQVGRNLADHPIILIYGSTPKPIYPFRSPLSTAGIDKFRIGEFRKHFASYRIELLNDGWNFPEGGFQPLLTSLLDQGFYGKQLKEEFNKIASKQVSLSVLTEMLPNPENRIVPSKEKFDTIGIPHPEIHFSLDEYTKKSFSDATKKCIEILEKSNCTNIKISNNWYGAGHVMGTYRMGDNAKDSVVDKNLVTHDHKNLILVGSGVMPTTGSANPTLTIAALSLRCADFIKKNLI